MGAGSAFEDINNPQPVIRVGDTSSRGIVEITGMVFTTRGHGMSFFLFPSCTHMKQPIAAGAIVMEWNVHDPAGQQGAAGMWDSHIR